MASPLYVAGVNIPGQGAHNVVYVATQHNSVYAFDADGLSATPVVAAKLPRAAGMTTVPAADTGECCDIAPEIGITGTPVIDPCDWHVVRRRENQGRERLYRQRLHALDIATGAEKFGGPSCAAGDGLRRGGAVRRAAREPATGAAAEQRCRLHRVWQPRRRAAVPRLGAGVQRDHVASRRWRSISVPRRRRRHLAGQRWSRGRRRRQHLRRHRQRDVRYEQHESEELRRQHCQAEPHRDRRGLLHAARPGEHQCEQLRSRRRRRDVAARSARRASHICMVSAGKNNTIVSRRPRQHGQYNPNNDSQIVQSLVNIFPFGTPEPGNYSAPVYFNGTVYFGPIRDNVQAFRLTNGLLSPRRRDRTTDRSSTIREPTLAISANGTATASYGPFSATATVACC